MSGSSDVWSVRTFKWQRESELRTMLEFSESESSSNASDDDESSDQDNLSSTNDSKDSGKK